MKELLEPQIDSALQPESVRKMQHTAFLLLGTGADNPGLYKLGLFDGACALCKELEHPNTPYALAFSPDLGQFATGTKCGQVEIYPSVPDGCGSALVRHEPVSLEKGVLSLCFLDSHTLLASTVDCHVVRIEFSFVPARLSRVFTADAPVCAMVNCGELGVAGLGIDGTVYTMEAPYCRATKRLTGPPPAEPACSVRLIPWPIEGHLAYPARNGGLAVIELVVPQVTVGVAHNGESICLQGPGKTLLTIGRRDGQIKAWRNPTTQEMTCAAPEGIIAGGLLAGAETTMVLIDHTGSVGVYSLVNGHLAIDRPVDVRNCRVIGSPPTEAVTHAVQRWKNAEAERIGAEIRDGAYRTNGTSQEKRHATLCRLGHEPMSLRLRAWHASEKGDSKTAKEYRMRMMNALYDRAGDPDSLYEAARYADSLGYFERAQEFLSRLDKLHPGVIHDPNAARLRARAQCADGQPAVIDIGEAVAIAEVAELAARLGLAAPRKFMVKHYQAFRCAVAEATLEGVLAELEPKYSHANCPFTLISTRLLWFGVDREELADILVIRQPSAAAFAVPELAVKISRSHTCLVIEPVGVIAFPAMESLPERADTLCAALELSLIDAWFNDAHEWLGRCIQEWSNRMISKKRWGLGEQGNRLLQLSSDAKTPGR